MRGEQVRQCGCGNEETPSRDRRGKRFARVASGNGFPLVQASALYVQERSPGNPFNFKPLSAATVKELEIALKHLRSFLEDTEETACMEDVTPELARRFRYEFL